MSSKLLAVDRAKFEVIKRPLLLCLTEIAVLRIRVSSSPPVFL